MKIKIMVGLAVAMIAGAVQAQTYTWANSNVSNTPKTNDWFTGGPNTQGTWTEGTPVSDNLNTIRFFPNTTANLSYTAINTQVSNLNNGGAPFQLGALTLNGLASSTINVNVTMNVTGDALNFSAATGTLNLNSLNVSGNNRNLGWNVNNNIQLGTASSSSIFTLIGDGTSAFNFGGSITELQAGGGSKFIKSGTSTLTINGVVAVSGGLELNGGTLNMGNAGNAVTGGIVLNGGTLAPSNASLSNNNITVNGVARLNMAGSTTIRGGITLNTGANLTLATNNSNATSTNDVTGVGSITISRNGMGSHTQNLNSTNNTFTGSASITGDSNLSVTLNVNSLVDSFGAGNIRFTGTASATHTFAYGGGAIAPLTLDNRRIEIVSGSSAPITIANNSGQAFTINTDLLVGATGSRTLTFGGSGAGLSSFNGAITNGTLTTLNIAKSGTGTWVLSGNNTYSGTTTVSDGKLVVAGSSCLSDTNALYIASGKTVQLEAGVKEKIGKLFLNSVQQLDGVWGAVGNSKATYTSSYLLGTGLLYVNVDLPASGTIILLR
jgi:autotransporter-associated beta strand protein